MASSVSAQHAHEGDIALAIENGRIVTGMEEDDGHFHHERVFGAELGEDPSLPFYAEDPGFDNELGTFTPETSLGFRFTGSILRWTGSGFNPTSATFTASYREGPTTLTATSGAGPVDGFGLLVSDDGTWHRHLGWTLNGLGGADPEVGIYAARLSLWSDLSTLRPSEEFWIVFNQGDTEENHDLAQDFARGVVPEPMTGMALGLGLAGWMARRRRQG